MTVLSRMQLTQFRIEELLIRSKKPGSDPEATTNFNIELEHGRAAEKLIFTTSGVLSIDSELETSQSIASIEIKFIGVFQFADGMTDEQISSYFPTVAFANLLGLLRASLMHMTSLFPGGVFVLPLVDLSEMNLITDDGRRTIFPDLYRDTSGDDA